MKPVSEDYEPQEQETSIQPVRLLLRRRDKTFRRLLTDVRVMDDHAVVCCQDVYYTYRGNEQVEGLWFRVYYEVGLIDARTMTAG